MSLATDRDTAAPTPAESTPSRWPRRLALVAATLVALAGIAWVALGWLTPHPYSGTVYQAPTAAPSMDGLVYPDGSPVDLADFEGELLLVYFGYTACPDVCPTTLAQAAAARRQLDAGDAERVRLIMISVDPERDTPELLEEYVASFDPSFVAATGTLEAIERVASQYGVFFEQGDALGDGYAVDHTATLMGIDPDGHLRIVWPPLLDVDRLAADLDELL